MVCKTIIVGSNPTMLFLKAHTAILLDITVNIHPNVLRYIRGVGQAAKLQPFHGCEMGSIPIHPTTGESAVSQKRFSAFITRNKCSK